MCANRADGLGAGASTRYEDHRCARQPNGHRAAFEHDRGRDAELAVLGYVVVRFTWRQVRDEPVLVAAQLAQVLGRRSPPRAAAG